jgi:ribosomal protein L28
MGFILVIRFEPVREVLGCGRSCRVRTKQMDWGRTKVRIKIVALRQWRRSHSKRGKGQDGRIRNECRREWEPNVQYRRDVL